MDDEFEGLGESTAVSLPLKYGVWYGGMAGCLSAGLFTFILLIAFSFIGVSNGFNEYLENVMMGGVFIGLLAIPFGLIPATVIGVILGSVTAIFLNKFQGTISNRKRAMGLGVIVSLTLGLPAISFWWAYFLAGFELKAVQFGIGTFFHSMFILFCAGTGMFIGRKLFKELKGIKEVAD